LIEKAFVNDIEVALWKRRGRSYYTVDGLPQEVGWDEAMRLVKELTEGDTRD